MEIPQDAQDLVDEIISGIESGELEDQNDILQRITAKSNEQLRSIRDALEYLIASNNDEAVFDQVGELRIYSGSNPWCVAATYAFEQDVMDGLGNLSALLDNHRPGNRCCGCGDRITDDDEVVTNTQTGEIYERICALDTAEGFTRCGAESCLEEYPYGACIPDNRMGCTQVGPVWFHDDCLAEMERDDEEDD